MKCIDSKVEPSIIAIEYYDFRSLCDICNENKATVRFYDVANGFETCGQTCHECKTDWNYNKFTTQVKPLSRVRLNRGERY